jgi:hypothetical protein
MDSEESACQGVNADRDFRQHPVSTDRRPIRCPNPQYCFSFTAVDPGAWVELFWSSLGHAIGSSKSLVAHHGWR